MANCETMVATATTLQALESNQASVVDDASAKTIEFLRARLLSERVASKAARQQAQEIAEKVKELNVRLEMEIKSRKEAESAMGKVFTILKAKGLALDALASTADLKDQPKEGVGALDDVKEMNEDPPDFSASTIASSVIKEVSPKKDESAEKGMIEQKKLYSRREPHVSDRESGIGIVSEGDQTLETPYVKEMNEDPRNFSTCTIASSADKEVSPKKDESAEKGMIEEKKYSRREPHASDLQSGIGIVSEGDQTLETACNMCEEALPQHAVAVADKPMVYTDNMSPKCPPNVKKFSNTAEAFDEGSSITLKLKAMLHQMEEEMAALPKEQQPLKLQLRSWVDHVAGVLDMEKESGLNTDTIYPPPTRKDPAHPNKVFHNRRSSYDTLHFSQQPADMPVAMQFGISQPPLFANGYTANGPPYYVEAQSPRSSNAFSLADGTGYRHRQLCETRSQERGLGIERQAGYGEDALKCRSEMWSQAGFVGSRDMLSSPYIVDVSDEVHSQNIHLRRGHSYSHGMYLDQAKNEAELNMARLPQSFPVCDATLSLADDRNGRLGDILMVLDSARQRVNEEEQSHYAEGRLFGPPTPTVEEARLKKGCLYGDDKQQMPYEHLNHVRRSLAQSRAPIIQPSPSPASEHGYSPFERHGRHRRSSSVSANFPMFGWDGHPQSRGEVQLGNGITLYTD